MSPNQYSIACYLPACVLHGSLYVHEPTSHVLQKNSLKLSHVPKGVISIFQQNIRISNSRKLCIIYLRPCKEEKIKRLESPKRCDRMLASAPTLKA